MPNDGSCDFGGAIDWRARTEAADARVAALQNLCAEVYQVVGSLSTLLPDDHDTTTRVLDNLDAAASDEPLPHAELLPYVLPTSDPVMPEQPSANALHTIEAMRGETPERLWSELRYAVMESWR
jgi:hypothetical protein